ncbi:MAG TPA: ATP-binding cassette domain-containing protein [Acidimicrobiales bacterium]|nr:ATP-binding cassette domain-containing protein [Acidimicrobiales bacterium]
MLTLPGATRRQRANAAPPPAPDPPAPGGAVLEVRGVSKRFGRLQVLDGVSLDIGAGEVVALVGDNGAGKSTLVRCIARATAPEAGTVAVGGATLGPNQGDAAAAGIAVVWQDLALCDNLDTVANLFLGHEDRRLLLDDTARQVEARRLLQRFNIAVPDLTRPVAALSGGQRQVIAMARALDGDPRLLVLDEPTASLGRSESEHLLGLVRRLADTGTAVLLVTHDLDHVFELSDRIVVLRQGRIVGEVSPSQVHPDDVVAMQLGVEVDSTASRQLRRLGSLVEQLSEVEPAASLPLVVSAMAAALGEERLCVHLLDGSLDGGPPGAVLRRSAAVALPDELLARNAVLPVGRAGGIVGLAAASSATVVTDDVRTDPAWAPLRDAAASAGVLSGWAAPITGTSGVLGTISGYGDTVGRPRADQLALIALYASHAAASIERERMYAEARRRNRVLEAIHTVLEALAGPQQVHDGLDGALVALRDVLGADRSVIRVAVEGTPRTRSATGGVVADGPPTGGEPAPPDDPEVLTTADAALRSQQAVRMPTPDGGTVVAVPFRAPAGPAALAVRWADAARAGDGVEILHDAARSMSLALEREQLEAAHHEAQALRQSQRLQRDLLSRLSHELRTPLTAIHGCVDTLRQPDVEWPRAEQDRFLATIAAESERMKRLVADLFDVSALDAGIFRLQADWCDLRLVAAASVACAAPGPMADRVDVAAAADLPPVWADHDRIEQVLVNLLENAFRHAPTGGRVRVAAAPVDAGTAVEVRVADEGEGVDPGLTESLFLPHVASAATGGTGLGLAIARGIARAHGGELALAPDAPGTTFVLTLPVSPGSCG